MTPKKAFLDAVNDYKKRWWKSLYTQDLNWFGKLIIIPMIVFIDVMALSILPIIFIINLGIKDK